MAVASREEGYRHLAGAMAGDRRPWPRPRRPWVMFQSWRELLFAHWPIDLAPLRALVPQPLEVDAFEGTAWLGVVPFTLTGLHLHWLPPLPGLSSFHEINVRTYVRHGGKPGIWFFSLDASNGLAARAARLWYRLPYFRSSFSFTADAAGVRCASARRQRGAPPAELRARYGPCGEVAGAERGSLDEWLTERYCLYTADRRGRIFRAEIDHAPWPLQPAWADIEANTMAQASGLCLPDTKPQLHFSRRQDAVVWSLERVENLEKEP